ncbi:hypothetical protein AMAG_10767 [Allomyces macrogynus ATCC 38327]|uniref:Kinesin-like protein n=1 Tax=Allomyces macrogynus (strain ATCC 38327) TaxID=578462 RepID=A0A0L0SRK1_ALLM3|nr:hypothetical protein AMAG_10767 [Allomyces macrogynus ATCC 38327]|eukprot:KNE65111.1 hypothetical protein AMAG_10767 [Allomyces macrogynus ATCC 38327]
MAPPPAPKRSVLANSSKSTVNASRMRRNEMTKRTGSSSNTSFAPPPPAPTSRNSNGSGSEPPVKKTKRATWDTKGRLEDLEATFKNVQDTMAGYKETAANLADTLKESNKRIRELESFKTSLEDTVHAKTQENDGMAHELAQLRHELAMAQDRHQQQLQRALAAHQAEVMQLKIDRDDLDRRNALLKHELDHANENVANLRSALSTSTVASTALEAKVRTLTMQLDDTKAELTSTKSELDVRAARVDELEAAVRAAETERRKLHNTIQELKGNIRVFCRVRPVLGKEQEKEERMARMVFAPSGKAVELVEASKSADGSKTVTKALPFAFDRVFDPSATQTAVFDEISQLVQSALDGYNVCIFAYGQTGSGKTFTMEGAGPSPNDAVLIDVDDAAALNAAAYADDHRGMIPRAVDQIFASAAALKEQGWTYTFRAQYIEIYNETLRDLLAPPNANQSIKYQIQHGNGRTIVTDATVVDVTSPAQIHAMLVRAARNRAVATTNMNERSSRSHSVFSLAIDGVNATTGESGRGTINLVDLAGSERLNQSGAVGDRLKETQAINKSLSALGDVMVALANRDAHVPYRNSKLTYLLQQSLGGNSKTLMFVNVSPLEKSFNETVNSLRFATKVNTCQIGTARKNPSKSG